MASISNSFLFDGSVQNKCLVFLNTTMDSRLFRYLWSTTEIHVTADGAANLLYSMFPEDRDTFIPDYIIGDFDSASETTLKFYEQHGTTILKDSNQDNTDLDKCLLHIHECYPTLHVVIYGDLGGRFDHSFGIINSMMVAKDYFEDLVLVGAKGTLRILKPGITMINRCAAFSNRDGSTCGLIPVGGFECSHVTTTGLKWNLQDSSMQFGYLVSSSNCMIDNSVTVDCPYPLIWTLSIHWDLDWIVCCRFNVICVEMIGLMKTKRMKRLEYSTTTNMRFFY